MKIALGLLLVLHGAIHLLGFAKGVGIAAVTQLTHPISTGLGFAWLVAALGFGVAAVLMFTDRPWWIAGLPAVVLSQVLISGAWSDAKVGTIPNVLLGVALVVRAWS